MRVLAALLLALGALTPLGAHEGDLKKAAKAAKAAVSEAGKAVAAGAKEAQAALQAVGKEAAVGIKAAAGEPVAQLEPLELVKQHAGAHWHNRIVHFPVALGLIGVLFLLAALRWPGALGPGRWLLLLAGLGGLAALFTGGAQEGEYDGTSLVKAVEMHELGGKICVGALFGCLLLSFFPSAKKWSWLAYLALAALVSGVAALGGAIAHS